MFRVKDMGGESIVVDGGWVEKFRTGDSRGRAPAADYKGLERAGSRPHSG